MTGRAVDVDLLRTVVAAARDEGVTFLAAAVAYYAFVSIVPLTLLSVAVASAVGGPALADRAVGTLERFLTPEAQTVVRDALTEGSGRGAATVVGVVTLLWGGLKVFRGLDRAFSQVYGTGEFDSFLGAIRNATVALAAIGAGVVAVAVVDAAVRLVLPDLPTLAAVFGTTTLLATLVAALFPLYYLFPGVRMSPWEALPGAVFAAVGWTLLEVAFGAYVTAVGSSSVYGFLGGALLLVTWLYFGAIVVILGAVVNAALAGRGRPPTEDRQLQHPGPRHPRPEQMPRGDDTGAGEGGDADPTDPDGSDAAPGNPEAGSDDGSGGPPVTDGGRPPGDDPGEDGSGGDPGDESGNAGGSGDDPGDDPGEDGSGDADRPGDDSGVDGDGDSGGDGDGREVDGPDHFWEHETEDVGGGRSAAGTGSDGDGDPADGDGTSGGEDDASGGGDDASGGGDGDPGGGDDGSGGGGWRDPDGDPRDRTDAGIRAELDRLWEDLEELESHVDDRTVSRSSLESELRAYVRRRMRRGHARGWGPYLVLLYGTAMTLGAFYYLDGIWAILAMIVLWLSTLGLYTLMIIVGVGIGLLGFVARARGLVRGLRSEE